MDYLYEVTVTNWPCCGGRGRRIIIETRESVVESLGAGEGKWDNNPNVRALSCKGTFRNEVESFILTKTKRAIVKVNYC